MPPPNQAVRVWDAPTRLFHWGIVVLVATSWVTQHQGWLNLHFLSGYTILAALLFRLAWGCVGSDTARFVRFLKGPGAALHHLAHLYRREPDSEVGHNAVGGWMVVLMLALLCVQVGTGLCSNDQISTQGPLADWVGPEDSDWLSHIHAVNFRLIEAAIALHVLAIVIYRVLKGHNLVGPMITGNKTLPHATTPPRHASPLLAATLFLAAAIIVAGGVWWFGGWPV
jgi:cytochrome b